jgi:hypothetical protein
LYPLVTALPNRFVLDYFSQHPFNPMLCRFRKAAQNWSISPLASASLAGGYGGFITRDARGSQTAVRLPEREKARRSLPRSATRLKTPSLRAKGSGFLGALTAYSRSTHCLPDSSFEMAQTCYFLLPLCLSSEHLKRIEAALNGPHSRKVKRKGETTLSRPFQAALNY